MGEGEWQTKNIRVGASSAGASGTHGVNRMVSVACCLSGGRFGRRVHQSHRVGLQCGGIALWGGGLGHLGANIGSGRQALRVQGACVGGHQRGQQWGLVDYLSGPSVGRSGGDGRLWGRGWPAKDSGAQGLGRGPVGHSVGRSVPRAHVGSVGWLSCVVHLGRLPGFIHGLGSAVGGAFWRGACCSGRGRGEGPLAVMEGR